MKKQCFTLCTFVLFVSFSVTAFSQAGQPSQKAPKWLSPNGYWIVESNVKTPKSSTIYFYNNENTIVYKERVEGVKLHLNRKKTLLRLRNVLDESITAWQQHHISKENQMLVATAFRK